MKKKYTYILFDWDGCLAKTLDIILDLYRELFVKFGLPQTDEKLISIWGDWEGPLKLGLPKENLSQWIAEYKVGLKLRVLTVDLYEGVEDMLSILTDSGKLLALLSSSEKSSIEPILDRYDLRKYFQVFLYADDVKHHKPDPEIIEKALSLLGGKKSEAIIVGDSKSDLGAAQNAGIDSVLYFPSHNELFYKRENLEKLCPTYTIENFNQLFAILQ
jgi:HAD superfamily hydrolase (TIGR01509 family)